MVGNVWDDYQVDVPEGESGRWKIRRCEAKKDDLSLFVFNMKAGSRSIPPETQYTELTRDGETIMTDTPAEIRDHYEFFRNIRYLKTETYSPTVLIHGLGLGMAVNGAFMSGAGHVTVVEKSPDVIRLVGPYWKTKYGDRLKIIEGDAYTWQPEVGQRWAVVWHDIWDNLSTDNLVGMSKLHRRFGRRCVCWQGSWCVDVLRARQRKEKKAHHTGWAGVSEVLKIAAR